MTTEALAAPPNPVLDFAERYLFKIWVSRGCRFVANRRLQQKAHATQWMLSLLAVVVIAASIWLLYIPNVSAKTSNFINALTIIVSIFILVLSNLEFARNYQVTADRMLKGAQALSPLYDNLDLSIKTNKIDANAMMGFVSQYNSIINEFEVQHEDIDYVYFQTMHPARFYLDDLKGAFKRWEYRVRYFCYLWGFYLACIFIPLLIIPFVIQQLAA